MPEAARSPNGDAAEAPGQSLSDLDFDDAIERHDGAAAGVGFLAILARLPELTWLALGLSWEADSLALVLALAAQVLLGLMQAFLLLGAVGVLETALADARDPGRLGGLAGYAAVVIVSGVARWLLLAATSVLTARLGPRVDRVAKTRLLGLATRVDLAAFDDPEFLDHLDAADRATISGRQVVDSGVHVINSIAQLIAAAGVLGALHPVLLGLLVLSTLPQGVAAIRAARAGYVALLTRVRYLRRMQILSSYLTGPLAAIEVRAFGLGAFLIGRYRALASRQESELARVGRRQAGMRLAADAASGTMTAATYATLLLLVNRGLVSLAVAGGAVLALNIGKEALSALIANVNQLYETGLYLSEYRDWCRKATRRLPSPGRLVARGAPFEICVDRVTFTYPGADRPALDGVSLRLRRGEVVALVGENGSGKSTLAKILAGLYEPDRGAVRWDGVSLAAVDPASVRDQVAMIPQHFTQWPLSARLNVAVGRIERLAEDGHSGVVRAARDAGVDELIRALPAGYETLLARDFEGGTDLSGGQWQRLAIARAIYRDAPFLIADEPSASLDARAEHQLFDLIRRLAAGRTVLLITHRLASVRSADRIYVLERGRLIEEGTHDTLMRAGRLYAELYSMQASAYAPETAGSGARFP